MDKVSPHGRARSTPGGERIPGEGTVAGRGVTPVSGVVPPDLVIQSLYYFSTLERKSRSKREMFKPSRYGFSEFTGARYLKQTRDERYIRVQEVQECYSRTMR
jgi:hypothetical protein